MLYLDISSPLELIWPERESELAAELIDGEAQVLVFSLRNRKAIFKSLPHTWPVLIHRHDLAGFEQSSTTW